MLRFSGPGDIGTINGILNDASVRPYINPPGVTTMEPLDFTKVMGELVGLLVDGGRGGVFILKEIGPGGWELHTCLMPDYRGKKVEAIAAEMFEIVFCVMGAHSLFTFSSEDNRAASWMAMHMGFNPIGKGQWGEGRYELTLPRWVASDRTMVESGTQAMQAWGVSGCDSEISLRAFGMLAKFVNAGQTEAGIQRFNVFSNLMGIPGFQIIPKKVEYNGMLVAVSPFPLEAQTIVAEEGVCQ